MSSLSMWLTESNIQYINTVADWQESITLVAQPLLASGIISNAYVDNIITQKKILGPYFVIAPRIAMPHARPEDGANRLGLSLLKLRDGVSFGSSENDPVDIIVMFSAPDKDSHVVLISKLAEFLSDDDVMRAVFESKTKQELIDIINEFN